MALAQAERYYDQFRRALRHSVHIAVSRGRSGNTRDGRLNSLAGRRGVIAGAGVLAVGLLTLVIALTLSRHPRRRPLVWGQSALDGLAANTPAAVTVSPEVPFQARSMRSLCSYSGSALPLGVAEPVHYNLTIYLEARHFTADESEALQTFDADVAVTLALNQSTSCLLLHSVGLDYHHVWASDGAGRVACACGTAQGCPVKDCAAVVKPARGGSDMVVFDLGETKIMAGNQVTLHASYAARFSPGQGLYRSAPFEYYGGQYTSALLVSQLQPEGARRVFPSYDSPSHKARFEVAIQHPSDMIALSSTPASGYEAGERGGTTLTHFKPTPRISPYVLAVCVGTLEGSSTGSQSGTIVKAWSTPDMKWQLDTALKGAARAADFYAEWTGLDSPVPELTLVAVPGRPLAMQSLGLILFDEDRLLVHTGTEGAFGEWLCADVVCHQLAHQWFGNLATAANWAEMAVNDGLATFMEYKCIEAFSPLMNGAAFFQIATSPMGEWLGLHEGPRSLALAEAEHGRLAALVPQLGRDGGAVRASSPRTTHASGAALLGMLEAYWEALSPGSFRGGLQLYLKRQAYKTGSTRQLLGALLDVLYDATPTLEPQGMLKMDKIIVAGKLYTWFTKPGIPLLSVFDLRDNSSANAGAGFSQQMYVPAGASEEAGSAWFIPLPIGNLGFVDPRYGQDAREQEEHWSLDDESWLDVDVTAAAVARPDLSGIKLEKWWLANKGGLGLYRTLYTESHVLALVGRLRSLLSPEEKLADDVLQVARWATGPLREASALLEDAFPLSYAGKLPAESVLALYLAASQAQAATGGMGKYFLLLPVLNDIQRMQGLLSTDPACSKDLLAFVVALLQNHTDRLAGMVARSGKVGSYTEHPSQSNFLGRIVRPKLLVAAALAGDRNAVSAMCNLFKEHFSTDLEHNYLDADVRGAAYIVATAHPEGCHLDQDREEMWQLMLEKWQREPDSSESRRGLFAIAHTRDLELLKKTVDIVFDPSNNLDRPVAFTDRLALVRILSQSAAGREAVWSAMQNNWTGLAHKYGAGVWRLLEEAKQRLEQGQVGQLQAFFKSPVARHAPEGTEELVVGRLTQDLRWLDSGKAALCRYLPEFKQMAVSS